MLTVTEFLTPMPQIQTKPPAGPIRSKMVRNAPWTKIGSMTHWLRLLMMDTKPVKIKTLVSPTAATRNAGMMDVGVRVEPVPVTRCARKGPVSAFQIVQQMPAEVMAAEAPAGES